MDQPTKPTEKNGDNFESLVSSSRSTELGQSATMMDNASQGPEEEPWCHPTISAISEESSKAVNLDDWK